MSAIIGDDPTGWQPVGGVCNPGTSMANVMDGASLTCPCNVAFAQKCMKQAGYKDHPMRLIGPIDIPAPVAMTQVAANLFRCLGFHQDAAFRLGHCRPAPFQARTDEKGRLVGILYLVLPLRFRQFRDAGAVARQRP